MRILTMILFAFAFLPVAARASSGANQADVESAIAFVKKYVAHYRQKSSSNKLAKKLIAHWDVDSVTADIFGSDLQGKSNRKAVRNKLAEMFAIILADENLRTTMRQVKVLQPCGVAIGTDRAVVSFVASIRGRSFCNLFVLRHTGNSWKITDSANGGKGGRLGFVRGFKIGYQKARRTLTPIQFIDEIIHALQQNPGK